LWCGKSVSHSIVPVQHPPRCTLHVSIIKKNISRRMESGIDRERLRIGTKHGLGSGPAGRGVLRANKEVTSGSWLVSHWPRLLYHQVAFSAAKGLRYSPLNSECSFLFGQTLIKTDSSGKSTCLIQILIGKHLAQSDLLVIRGAARGEAKRTRWSSSSFRCPMASRPDANPPYTLPPQILPFPPPHSPLPRLNLSLQYPPLNLWMEFRWRNHGHWQN